MEDIFGFLFITIFMEVFVWGIAYGTGYILTPIISCGKWYPDSLKKDKDTGKKLIKQTGITLIKKSDKVYLGAVGVSWLGFGFWGIIIIFLMI